MTMTLVPEKEEGARRDHCAAGVGQGVDLRRRAPRAAPKTREHYAQVLAFINHLGQATEPVWKYVSEFKDKKGHNVFSHKAAYRIVQVCRRLLQNSWELSTLSTVPARRSASTAAASRACVESALACLHHVAVFERLPSGWIRQKPHRPLDFSLAVTEIRAAIAAGRLSPPAPDLQESRLADTNKAAMDAIEADRSAWMASPWAQCAQAVPVVYHLEVATAVDAIEARFRTIEVLVAPDVLKAARDKHATFLQSILQDLTLEIRRQLDAKGNKPRAMAVIKDTRMRKCPPVSVFAGAMRHGLLWPEMPQSAYPKWFVAKYWSRLTPELRRVEYFLVSNSVATALPEKVPDLLPRLF